jgi:5-methylcytosine-specific restriction endonuclease McrA
MATLAISAGDSNLKRCCTCKRNLPRNLFAKSKGNKDGLQKRCKNCARSYFQRPEVVAVQQRKRRVRYLAERSEIIAASSEYYVAHRERILESHRNNAAYKSRHKRHRDENREVYRERARANRQKPESKAWFAAYRKRNSEKIRRYMAEHAKRFPELYIEKQKRRQALKAGLVVGCQKEVVAFYKLVRSAERIRCEYCKKLLAKNDREVDHMVPLSRRGAHAVENLCCSCVFCNRSKGTKTKDEFLAARRLVKHE